MSNSSNSNNKLSGQTNVPYWKYILLFGTVANLNLLRCGREYHNKILSLDFFMDCAKRVMAGHSRFEGEGGFKAAIFKYIQIQYGVRVAINICSTYA